MGHYMPGYVAGRTITPREFSAGGGKLEYLVGGGILDGTNGLDRSNTDYTYEWRAGWWLGRITSSGKLRPCPRTLTNGAGRASTTLVVDNAAAFRVGEEVTIGGNQVFDILKVEDNDNAASTGLAVYLHIDELSESPFGHLESVTAGNADSTFTTLGGAVVKVEDDDAAATGGVAIYFDEDATNPDERFLAAVPTGKDAFILASDGRAIRIKYHATPSTPGVLVYFDDDGATTSERLLFVSPTNVDGFLHTDDTVNVNPSQYVTRDTGNVVVSVSSNTITITDAATWADGDVVRSEDGSANAVGILGEFARCRNSDNTEAADKTAKVCIGGPVNQDMLLGDSAAVLADSSAKLNGFTIYASGVLVQ